MLVRIEPGEVLEYWVTFGDGYWVPSTRTVSSEVNIESYEENRYRIISNSGIVRYLPGYCANPAGDGPAFRSSPAVVQYWSSAINEWTTSTYGSLTEVIQFYPPQAHGNYRSMSCDGIYEYAPGYSHTVSGGPAHEITEQDYQAAIAEIAENCNCSVCRLCRRTVESYKARQEILANYRLSTYILSPEILSPASPASPTPEVTVPNEINTVPAVFAPEPAPQAPNLLVDVGISRSKPTNRLELVINAKALHDHLDLIGVPHTGGVYQDQPETNRVLSGNVLSTSPFLRREYPLRIDLTGVFNTPPTRTRLTSLCRTAHDAVRRVLEHYQPVDIRVSIHKRVAG